MVTLTTVAKEADAPHFDIVKMEVGETAQKRILKDDPSAAVR